MRTRVRGGVETWRQRGVREGAVVRGAGRSIVRDEGGSEG